VRTRRCAHDGTEINRVGDVAAGSARRRSGVAASLPFRERAAHCDLRRNIRAEIADEITEGQSRDAQSARTTRRGSRT
jgi:hypothetical protein